MKVFTLSFDFELAWGFRDKPRKLHSSRDILANTSGMVERVLELLIHYDISATWAVVGCLMVDSLPSPRIYHLPLPEQNGGRILWHWYQDAYNTSEPKIWFAPHLVEKIATSPVYQEIATHSFSHLVFADCAQSSVEADLKLALQIGDRFKIRSLVFPRNQVDHLDILKKNGIICFRGSNNEWYWKLRGLSPFLRLVDEWLAFTPRTCHPSTRPNGLIEIPHSMFLSPFTSVGKLIPAECRILKVKRALRRLSRNGGIFHLWNHLHNFAHRPEKMVDCFRKIIELVSRYRDQNEIEILTMRQIAEKYG